MSAPCIPPTVLGTFTCHPFVPPSSHAGTIVPISQMRTLRPRSVSWLVADPAFPAGSAGVSVELRAAQVGLGRGTRQESLQTRPCRPTPHHLGDFQSVPGWLDRLQKGWGVGTWSSCREPEEVTDGAVNAEDRRGLGMCWHLPHLGPDPGILRGRVGKHQGADW